MRGAKRSHEDAMGSKLKQRDAAETATSAFMPMFVKFRDELDEHHDRRERIIIASRDITAASKKLIFTLHRAKRIGAPLPNHIIQGNQQHHKTILNQFSSVSRDLQGPDAYRYARQISGGCQEWVEAASFEHYLTDASLLSYEDAALKMRKLDSEGPGVSLSHEDYLLGIYDMTGELMRFAITAMAHNGSLEAIMDAKFHGTGTMDSDMMAPPSRRNALTDMRTLRLALEGLDAGSGPLARDVEKKIYVMRESVEKVERALYGLTVRGAERPKGWMPDAGGSGSRATEQEA